MIRERELLEKSHKLRREKEFFLNILKIETRKRTENSIFLSEREIIGFFEIETLVNDCDVFVWLCICVCVFIFLFVYLCLCLCVCVCVFVFVFLCLCICVCVFVLVYLCLCLYICFCVFVFVYLCLWICVCVLVFVYLCLCICVCLCVFVCVCVCFCVTIIIIVAIIMHLYLYVCLFACLCLCWSLSLSLIIIRKERGLTYPPPPLHPPCIGVCQHRSPYFYFYFLKAGESSYSNFYPEIKFDGDLLKHCVGENISYLKKRGDKMIMGIQTKW